MSNSSPFQNNNHDGVGRIRRDLSTEETIEMIRLHLESIKKEIAAGSYLDPKVVEQLEEQLRQYEEDNPNHCGRAG